VATVALFHAAEKPTTLDPRLLDRGFTPEQLEVLRKTVTEEVAQYEITSLNVRISGDLRRFSFPEFDYVTNLHYIYKQTGALPYPGSISEQPAKIIEVFNIMDQLIMERQHREMEKRQRELKKNG